MRQEGMVKQIIVLALPSGYLMGISTPTDVFRIANLVWRYQNPSDPLAPFVVAGVALLAGGAAMVGLGRRREQA